LIIEIPLRDMDGPYELVNHVDNVLQPGDRDPVLIFQEELKRIPTGSHGSFLTNVLGGLIEHSAKLDDATRRLMKYVKKNPYIV
jgi:hypothetical protein